MARFPLPKIPTVLEIIASLDWFDDPTIEEALMAQSNFLQNSWGGESGMDGIGSMHLHPTFYVRQKHHLVLR